MTRLHLRPWVAALAAALVVKLALAARWGLSADEAYHWTWSRALALGYYDQPPLIAWALAAARALGGDAPLALRLPGIAAWGAAVAATAPLVRDRGLWVGWATALPPLLFLTNLAVPDVYLLAAWLAGLAAAARGGRGWWLAGVFGGLASLSKYTGVALLPLLILGATAAERRTIHPWIGLGAALALLAPNLWWNLDHDAVTVRFVLRDGLWHPRAPGWWGPWVQVAEQIAVVGPVAALAAGLAGARAARRWGSVERVDRLALATSAPLLLGFAVAAVGGPPEAHWPAPAWIGAGVLVARSGGRIARAGQLGVALAAVVSGLLALHSVTPLVELDRDPAARFTEAERLGEEVARWAAPAAGEQGPRPILTERYQEAAEITFTTGLDARVLPGCGRTSQYDLVPAPLPPEAVFVRPSTGGPPRCAAARCEGVRGPSRISTVDAHGRRVGPWDVFELEGCR
ncbi:MAG: glycosyltransferase family 39 protein [Myxococcota bacterium]